MVLTLQLMLYALLPPARHVSAQDCQKGGGAESGAVPGEVQVATGRVVSCAPRQIRGGMERFLDEGGELRLFFPGCMPIAAPFVLFRLKRQGFSGCYVRSAQRGLYVAARR